MKMPFGMHRGAALVNVPTDYLAWLCSLPEFTVSSLSEGRKRALQSAVAAELQRRLDVAGAVVAVRIVAELRPDGVTIQ